MMKTRVSGLTLTEIMLAMAIVGIVAAAMVRNHWIALQRQRWDASRDVLLTIASGELAYKSLNQEVSYFPVTMSAGATTLGGNCNVAVPAGFSAQRCLGYCTTATDPANCRIGWDRVFMEDPNLADVPAGSAIRYRVYTIPPPGPRFQAQAVRGTVVMTIDENRTIGGTWTRP